jgi:hypothetical protein
MAVVPKSGERTRRGPQVTLSSEKLLRDSVGKVVREFTRTQLSVVTLDELLELMQGVGLPIVEAHEFEIAVRTQLRLELRALVHPAFEGVERKIACVSSFETSPV